MSLRWPIHIINLGDKTKLSQKYFQSFREQIPSLLLFVCVGLSIHRKKNFADYVTFCRKSFTEQTSKGIEQRTSQFVISSSDFKTGHKNTHAMIVSVIGEHCDEKSFFPSQSEFSNRSVITTTLTNFSQFLYSVISVNFSGVI